MPITTRLLLFFSLAIPLQILSQSDSITGFTDTLQFNLQFATVDAGSVVEVADEQDISPLLQASRDIYAQFSGFQFSYLRYRTRGLSSTFNSVSINGICLNAIDSRQASFAGWAGLSDVIRYPESTTGIAENRSFFSGMANNLSFDSHAALFKKGSRYSYTVGNRSFSQRITAAIFSGLQKNNWAFAVAFSWRGANESYMPGTSLNAGSFYFSAEKVISHRHNISFTAIYTPQHQERGVASTQEVYDLVGSNFYNSNWGYQAGKVRSASESKLHQPLFFLLDTYTSNTGVKLQTLAFLKIGKKSSSGLNWFDAQNPDPDNYRNLPSYYYLQKDNSTGDGLTEAWQTDENLRQLNWDYLIQQNQNNLFSVNGGGINTTDTRARYILENRCEFVKQATLQSNASKRFGRHFIYATLRADALTTKYFKTINDLLGSSFWLDVNQFAEGQGVEELVIQNNIDAPNRKIRVNETFGYDYTLQNLQTGFFLGDNYHGKKWDAFTNVEAKMLVVQRIGHIANGRFANTSKGKSESINLYTGKIKTGLDYKLSGRQAITLRAEIGSQTPDTRQLFVSAASRNELIPTISAEKYSATELNYHLHYSKLRARIGAYASWQNNLMQMRSYWHDLYGTTVNMLLQNISHRQIGLEFGIETTLNGAHVFLLAGGLGKFIYTRNATVQAWNDNTAEQILKPTTAYIKNLRTGAGPESALGFSYRYNTKRFWHMSCQLNYVAGRYAVINPERRAAYAFLKYRTGDEPLVEQLLQQEKLTPEFFINVAGGRSYRFLKKYNVFLSVSINNVLNSKNMVASAYEQLRWDTEQPLLFPNKYSYAQGINILFQASINF